MQIPLAFAPMFELSGKGAEHTFFACLHRAATPDHLTTTAAPILVLALIAVLPGDTGPERILPLNFVGADHPLDPARCFRQYRVARCSVTGRPSLAPELLPAGTELRLRVRDISGPDDRRWRLQRRWPVISRVWPVSQAVLIVLVP